MMSPLALLATLPLLAIAGGCGSETTGPETGQEFPNAVGDMWVYAVRDSSAQPPRVDTVVTAIVLRTYTVAPGEPPDTSSSSRPALVWEMRTPTGTDSILVLRYTSSAVATAMRLTGRSPFRVIRFPLVVGAAWSTPDGGRDSVVAAGSITVPAGTYSNAYSIEGRYDGGTSWHRIWYVPFVGIVARDVHEGS